MKQQLRSKPPVLRKDKAYVLRLAKEHDVRFIRLWFTDILGFLKSVAITIDELEEALEEGLGFDPGAFSKAGNAACPFCGTVADNDYVKEEGCAGRSSRQMMAIVGIRPGKQGKVYLSADALPAILPDDNAIQRRIEDRCTM